MNLDAGSNHLHNQVPGACVGFSVKLWQYQSLYFKWDLSMSSPGAVSLNRTGA